MKPDPNISQETCRREVYEPFDTQMRSYLKIKDDPRFECNGLAKNNTDGKHLADCLKHLVNYRSPSNGGSASPTQQACWTTPSEQHTNYTLFFTEFDDAGWEADLRADPNVKTSEIDHVFQQLESLTKQNKKLDIVVYTHGWHGSSLPDDYYVVLFRALLESLAHLDSNVDPDRQVVGIYVGWRGNSWEHPSPAKYLTFWDRKLAAETVSAGAVQGLFARLHHFYIDNSCHPSGDANLSGSSAKCGRVHMLTIGHSYGALINFRSLLGNMEHGLNIESGKRVYSFGDLVVLLNPAFEGTRYAPLYYSATHRGNFVAPGDIRGGQQLPAVLTLQSVGDSATGDFFPIFRTFSTPADHPVGTEKEQNKRTVGWVPAFQTHRLCLDPQVSSPNPEMEKSRSFACTPQPGDRCDRGSLQEDLTCRIGIWASPSPNDSKAFSALWPEQKDGGVYMGKGMTLVKEATDGRPPYFPYWNVQVDKAIMADHDDVWNDLTTQFILQLYHAVVTQSEAQARCIRGAKC